MIKCIAIDDEPLALENTLKYISRIPFLQLLNAYNNALEAMEALLEQEVDLLFLDIDMPGLNGIELMQSLIVKPAVILTTAHPEYAIDGFKINAIDYLLKPFDFHELLKAADKARKQIGSHWMEEVDLIGSESQKEESLFVKTNSKVIRVNFSEILYIESIGEYIRIYIEGKKEPLETLLTLKRLEERLPTNSFMRTHSLYMVNLQKISEIFRSRIILKNGIYLPIGENYKGEFIQYINRISVSK